MGKADVVIVGAGHGGAQCAIALRQNGFTGRVVMVGREPEPPYERPPLSKEYFAREKTFERLYIRPPSFWEEKNLELVLGTEVTAIDPEARRVTLSNGDTLDCVNMVKDYVQGRKLVEGRISPELTRLADPAVPLKELLPG